MPFIFIIYEWCFAILTIILHKKIRMKNSLMLCTGMTIMASLITLIYIGNKLKSGLIIFTKILPAATLVVPILTITGLAILAINFEKYFERKDKNT